MWRKYFKLVGITPGPVVTHKHGKIDFSRNDLSLDLLKDLYEDNFEYLQLTQEGLEHLYASPNENSPNSNSPGTLNSDDSICEFFIDQVLKEDEHTKSETETESPKETTNASHKSPKKKPKASTK